MRRLFVAIGATLLLAAAPADPPERWIPYAKNPAWEIYGKEDAVGVFRYTQMRQKVAEQPVLNLGVNLPTLTQPREVMAPDAESAGLVYRAIRGEGEELGAAADCDDGRCDLRRKKPDKPPEIDIDWFNPNPEHIAAVAFAAVAVVILGLAAFIVVVLLIRFAVNLFRKRKE